MRGPFLTTGWVVLPFAWCAIYCTCLVAVAAQDAVDHTRTLQEQISKNFSWQPPEWQEVLKTETPSLLLGKIWEPHAPGAKPSPKTPTERLPITVTTTLTIERLGQLQLLCNSWPGPLIAGIWLPIVVNTDEPVDLIYYQKQLEGFEWQQYEAQQRRMERRSARQNSDKQPGRSKRKRKRPGRRRRRMRESGISERAPSRQLLSDDQDANSPEYWQQLTQPWPEQAREVPAVARTRLFEATQAIDQLILTIQEGRSLTPDLMKYLAKNTKVLRGAHSNRPGPLSSRSSSNSSSSSSSFLDTRQTFKHVIKAPDGAPSLSSQLSDLDHPDAGPHDDDTPASEAPLQLTSQLVGPQLQERPDLAQSAFISRKQYLVQKGRVFYHNSSAAAGPGSEAGSEAGGKPVDGKLPACQLTVMLFIQVFKDPVAPMFLFPINSLRNYASLMVRTPLVAMIDVDLIFNTHFTASLLSDPGRVADLVQDAEAGSLLIPPAFEAPQCTQVKCKDGVAAGQLAAHSSKQQLQNMLNKGWLDTFHCSKGTHWLVDYKQWFNSSTAYEVRYAHGAEPWFIAHKSMTPFYDTRFKGFGFNKILQLLYAAGNMRLRLRVLPDAWLIHIPHPHTTVSHAFKAKGYMKASRPPVSKNIAWTNSWNSGLQASNTSSQGTAAAPGCDAGGQGWLAWLGMKPACPGASSSQGWWHRVSAWVRSLLGWSDRQVEQAGGSAAGATGAAGRAAGAALSSSQPIGKLDIAVTSSVIVNNTQLHQPASLARDSGDDDDDDASSSRGPSIPPGPSTTVSITPIGSDQGSVLDIGKGSGLSSQVDSQVHHQPGSGRAAGTSQARRLQGVTDASVGLMSDSVVDQGVDQGSDARELQQLELAAADAQQAGVRNTEAQVLQVGSGAQGGLGDSSDVVQSRTTGQAVHLGTSDDGYQRVAMQRAQLVQRQHALSLALHEQHMQWRQRGRPGRQQLQAEEGLSQVEQQPGEQQPGEQQPGEQQPGEQQPAHRSASFREEEEEEAEGAGDWGQGVGSRGDVLQGQELGAVGDKSEADGGQQQPQWADAPGGAVVDDDAAAVSDAPASGEPATGDVQGWTEGIGDNATIPSFHFDMAIHDVPISIKKKGKRRKRKGRKGSGAEAVVQYLQARSRASRLDGQERETDCVDCLLGVQQMADGSEGAPTFRRALLKAADSQERVLYELLRSLYARMFHGYLWKLGNYLLKQEGVRLPVGEHPHVDPATIQLVATLPWWANYTDGWTDGMPSALRPPFLDPPAKSPWPMWRVKRMRAKLELCGAAPPVA